MKLILVAFDGIPFSSDVYFLRKPILHSAKSTKSSHVSTLQIALQKTINSISGRECNFDGRLEGLLGRKNI